MSREIDIPEDAANFDLEVHDDAVYVTVSFYDDCYRLLEEHTYADGPESATSEVEA